MARISPGTMTAAIFAILVGLAGAYTVRQYMSKPIAPPETDVPPGRVQVPTASIELMSGRAISVNDIEIHMMSDEEFENSVYADEPFMANPQQIAGRVLRSQLKRGDVFLTSNFYPEGMGPGVAENLKPGERAVTIQIDNIGAVAGFARAGTIVDVLFRSEAAEDLPEVTMTLLDRVGVLAVGNTFAPGYNVEVEGDDTNNTGTVTLAVSASQAKALKAVEGRGQVTLTLRSPVEIETVSSVIQQAQKVTLRQLLGLPEKVGPKKMDLYKGGMKETIVFGGQIDTTVDSRFPVNIRTPIASDDLRKKTILTPGRKSEPEVSAVGTTVSDNGS